MNGWFSNLAEKSPLLALVLALAIAIAAYWNSRDRYTASMAQSDKHSIDTRLNRLEWRMDGIQGSIESLKIPPQWFEERVDGLADDIKELKKK